MGNRRMIISTSKEHFIQAFCELFEGTLVAPDFGIYRMINFKQKQISKFIKEELPSIIDNELGNKEFSSEICDYLYKFFSQYYEKGNFIARPKCIAPDNDVLLYWRNRDQYYVKTDFVSQGGSRKKAVDFFIHKDLEGFLKRELDFFIKHEVLGLNKLSELDRVKTQLTKAGVIKNIAEKIIAFLAQIENFQKKLWLKRKFVLRTEYVITLDRIPASVKDEILYNLLNNEAQINEWRELGVLEGHLTREFLLSHPTLYVDTRYLPEELKLKLLASFEDLDEEIQGILIKSENFQALNLLLGKYREKVQCIYIDPPFKTGNDFSYPDRYENSSWITLIENRMRIAKDFLKNTGLFFIHLDKNAVHFGRLIADSIFGNKNFLNEIVWCYEKPRKAKRQFKENHDNILFYCKNYDSHYFQLLKTYSRFSNKEKDLGDWWWIPSFSTKMTASERLYFETQKPEELLETVIKCSSKEGDIVLDFFAGTGTTLAVAHKLKRKWIGVELGEVFNEYYLDYLKVEFKSEENEDESEESTQKSDILSFWEEKGKIYRIEKVVKQTNKESEAFVWKWGILSRMKFILAGSGKREPTKLSCDINWQGGGFFKYQYLEQYEDALDNIEFKREGLFEKGRPEYILTYMLDFETAGSPCRLDPTRLADPFNYKLRIRKRDGGFEDVAVDLIETFNYLMGIHVKKLLSLQDGERPYRVVLGLREKNRRVAVIWRPTLGMTEDDYKREREFLRESLPELAECEEIYTNADSVLDRAKSLDPLFMEKMWEE